MAAVESLCSRCLWIDAGKVRADGEARGVVSQYMRTFARSSTGSVSLEAIESRTGNGDGRFTHMAFLNEVLETTNCIRSGDRLTLRLHYRANRPLRDLVVGVNIHNEYGALIAASNNWATGDDIPLAEPGDGYADFEIDRLFLLPGRYYLSLWLGKWSNLHDVLKNCIAFDVEPSDYYGSGRGIDGSFGMMFFPSRWKSRAPQDNAPAASTQRDRCSDGPGTEGSP
jgi:hypothetical protein